MGTYYGYIFSCISFFLLFWIKYLLWVQFLYNTHVLQVCSSIFHFLKNVFWREVFFFVFVCLFVFCFFRAAPEAHEVPQQHRIRAASATYTTAHGNGGSLTHWARPGMESLSSWLLVRFATDKPQWELQGSN